MFTVTLQTDNSLFGYDFTQKHTPEFVKEFTTRKDAKKFFEEYVNKNDMSRPNKKASFAHKEGKELSCNF